MFYFCVCLHILSLAAVMMNKDIYRNLASASAGSLEDQTSCSEEEDVEVSAVASTESFKTSLNGLKWLVRSWR